MTSTRTLAYTPELVACVSCGKGLEVGSPFCRYCGKPQSLTCPKCGTVARGDAGFCAKCGTPLGGAPAGTPPAT